MTDDLITRLRNESLINQALKILEEDGGDVAADAANEIQRLRHLLRHVASNTTRRGYECDVCDGIDKEFGTP